MTTRIPFAVREDTAKTLRIVPWDEEIYTTPTCTLLKPNGASLATPTATLDTVDTTVSSATSGSVFVVASATGITVGRWYQIGIDGYTGLHQVAEVEGTTIKLTHDLPETPASGDTFKGVELSVPITATHSATRGLGYRILLRDTDNGDRESVHEWDVVRHPFEPAVNGSTVTSVLRQQWRNFPTTQQQIDELAAEVHRQMFEEVRQAERYPHLFLRRSQWVLPGEWLIRIKLGENWNLIPNGQSADTYLDRAYAQYSSTFGRALRQSGAYDTDDDDSAADETTGTGLAQLEFIR